MVERFTGAASAYPHRPAVVTDSGEMSFGVLDERSEEVARGLAGLGVGPETVVGVCLPRGVDLVVALLGTLRAGAALLPLDPAYPTSRLSYMLDDSRVRLVISEPGLALRPSRGVRTLTVDDLAAVAHQGRQELRPPRYRHQIAYTMYTSGSTGRPKGVQVTHGAVTALLDGLEDVIGPPPARVGWNASFSFDASVQQWVRLCRGDTVVLFDDATRSDPEAMARFVVDRRLDELDITPSHLRVLLDRLRLGELRRPLRLLIGGEAVDPALWRTLADAQRSGAVRAVNLYGPTECTVDATATPIDDCRAPHLGWPLPGVRVHVLDDAFRPVPAGKVGELFVAGVGVARGYTGRPGLTAERFLPDVVVHDGSRMYRTGDRVLRRSDGRLEFIGRVDDQVKLRGFRVELGEVEHVLAECPGVAGAVVVLRHDLAGGAGLVAYCRPTGPVSADAIRRAAAARLPDFMVPAAVLLVDRFPTSPNGKVDRTALPAPVFAPRSDREGGREGFVAPSGALEELVARTWSEMLGMDGIGATDDFFDLGGDSHLAIRAVTRLRQTTGWPVPMTAVFKHPRLRDFAAALAAAPARSNRPDGAA